MTVEVAFLGALDLTVCGILFKLCLAPSATGIILKDPQTGRIYYLSNIPAGKRLKSEALNESDESEDENYGERTLGLTSCDVDSLESFGWEGEIISQLISSSIRDSSELKRKTTVKSKTLTVVSADLDQDPGASLTASN